MPKVDIISDNPYDYSKPIFDDIFIDMIVTETNHYASQYLANTVFSLQEQEQNAGNQEQEM